MSSKGPSKAFRWCLLPGRSAPAFLHRRRLALIGDASWLQSSSIPFVALANNSSKLATAAASNSSSAPVAADTARDTAADLDCSAGDTKDDSGGPQLMEAALAVNEWKTCTQHQPELQKSTNNSSQSLPKDQQRACQGLDADGRRPPRDLNAAAGLRAQLEGGQPPSRSSGDPSPSRLRGPYSQASTPRYSLQCSPDGFEESREASTSSLKGDVVMGVAPAYMPQQLWSARLEQNGLIAPFAIVHYSHQIDEQPRAASAPSSAPIQSPLHDDESLLFAALHCVYLRSLSTRRETSITQVAALVGVHLWELLRDIRVKVATGLFRFPLRQPTTHRLVRLREWLADWRGIQLKQLRRQQRQLRQQLMGAEDEDQMEECVQELEQERQKEHHSGFVGAPTDVLQHQSSAQPLSALWTAEQREQRHWRSSSALVPPLKPPLCTAQQIPQQQQPLQQTPPPPPLQQQQPQPPLPPNQQPPQPLEQQQQQEQQEQHEYDHVRSETLPACSAFHPQQQCSAFQPQQQQQVIGSTSPCNVAVRQHEQQQQEMLTEQHGRGVEWQAQQACAAVPTANSPTPAAVLFRQAFPDLDAANSHPVATSSGPAVPLASAAGAVTGTAMLSSTCKSAGASVCAATVCTAGPVLAAAGGSTVPPRLMPSTDDRIGYDSPLDLPARRFQLLDSSPKQLSPYVAANLRTGSGDDREPQHFQFEGPGLGQTLSASQAKQRSRWHEGRNPGVATNDSPFSPCGAQRPQDDMPFEAVRDKKPQQQHNNLACALQAGGVLEVMRDTEDMEVEQFSALKTSSDPCNEAAAAAWLGITADDAKLRQDLACVLHALFEVYSMEWSCPPVLATLEMPQMLIEPQLHRNVLLLLLPVEVASSITDRDGGGLTVKLWNSSCEGAHCSIDNGSLVLSRMELLDGLRGLGLCEVPGSAVPDAPLHSVFVLARKNAGGPHAYGFTAADVRPCELLLIRPDDALRLCGHLTEVAEATWSRHVRVQMDDGTHLAYEDWQYSDLPSSGPAARVVHMQQIPQLPTNHVGVLHLLQQAERERAAALEEAIEACRRLEHTLQQVSAPPGSAARRSRKAKDVAKVRIAGMALTEPEDDNGNSSSAGSLKARCGHYDYVNRAMRTDVADDAAVPAAALGGGDRTVVGGYRWWEKHVVQQPQQEQQYGKAAASKAPGSDPHAGQPRLSNRSAAPRVQSLITALRSPEGLNQNFVKSLLLQAQEGLRSAALDGGVLPAGKLTMSAAVDQLGAIDRAAAAVLGPLAQALTPYVGHSVHGPMLCRKPDAAGSQSFSPAIMLCLRRDIRLNKAESVSEDALSGLYVLSLEAGGSSQLHHKRADDAGAGAAVGNATSRLTADVLQCDGSYSSHGCKGSATGAQQHFNSATAADAAGAAEWCCRLQQPHVWAGSNWAAVVEVAGKKGQQLDQCSQGEGQDGGSSDLSLQWVSFRDYWRHDIDHAVRGAVDNEVDRDGSNLELPSHSEVQQQRQMLHIMEVQPQEQRNRDEEADQGGRMAAKERFCRPRHEDQHGQGGNAAAVDALVSGGISSRPVSQIAMLPFLQRLQAVIDTADVDLISKTLCCGLFQVDGINAPTLWRIDQEGHASYGLAVCPVRECYKTPSRLGGTPIRVLCAAPAVEERLLTGAVLDSGGVLAEDGVADQRQGCQRRCVQLSPVEWCRQVTANATSEWQTTVLVAVPPAAVQNPTAEIMMMADGQAWVTYSCWEKLWQQSAAGGSGGASSLAAGGGAARVRSSAVLSGSRQPHATAAHHVGCKRKTPPGGGADSRCCSDGARDVAAAGDATMMAYPSSVVPALMHTLVSLDPALARLAIWQLPKETHHLTGRNAPVLLRVRSQLPGKTYAYGIGFCPENARYGDSGKGRPTKVRVMCAVDRSATSDTAGYSAQHAPKTASDDGGAISSTGGGGVAGAEPAAAATLAAAAAVAGSPSCGPELQIVAPFEYCKVAAAGAQGSKHWASFVEVLPISRQQQQRLPAGRSDPSGPAAAFNEATAQKVAGRSDDEWVVYNKWLQQLSPPTT